MAGIEPGAGDMSSVEVSGKTSRIAPAEMSREEREIHVATALAEGFRQDKRLPGGKQSGSEKNAHTSAKNVHVTIDDVMLSARKTDAAIAEAARNRGRETNAFKATHDHLLLLSRAQIESAEKLRFLREILEALAKVKDWDKPQWFKSEPANWRDESGKRITEHQFIVARNRLTAEQIARWDAWAAEATKQFVPVIGDDKEQIENLDNYLVRRVAVDSVKNWLRRRPEEAFIHRMFEALALNKLYLGDPLLRIKCIKDDEGHVRQVEMRENVLYFEGTDEIVPLKSDEAGQYVELPLDTDLIIFEKREALKGEIIPIAQPNARDPNIQWFGGAQVKLGWGKEERFFKGPQCFSLEELYGFFPEHFPMRITNSAENGKPTLKTGAAIYGYARDHAGRQARQLIAEYGDVMTGLKRNNSQLISDVRVLFGLQRSTQPSAAGQDSTTQAAERAARQSSRMTDATGGTRQEAAQVYQRKDGISPHSSS